ncbi:MAG: hypothetical protein ACYTGC_14935, partial [Planctomycetota bacterium]
DVRYFETTHGGYSVTFDPYGRASSDVLMLLRSSRSEYRWVRIDADTGQGRSWAPGQDDD